MKSLPLVLLLIAMLGCGSETEPAKTPAKTPAKAVVSIVNSIGMRFVPIQTGTFTMGNDKTAHKVTLTQSFHLGQHEVTQEQYERVMEKTPSKFKGAQNPVENVSWNDAVEFCRKLSELPGEKSAGYVYRLPTEAEWEYANRAGTTTEYSFGDSDSELGDYAWYYKNSGGTTHPVGGKLPNAWGLYDMNGNVWEWCQDWRGKYPSGPVTDPTGPSSGSDRVKRGGSWGYSARYCRSGSRLAITPGIRLEVLGFRVLRSSILPAETAAPAETPNGSDESSAEPAKAGDDQAQEVPEQPAKPAAESAGNLRLREIDKSKRSPGKTAIDVFVVNQSKEPITVYCAPTTPHSYLAVQIKQPNGKVYRLIDAYPTRDIALFEKYFIEVAPGKELKLCSYEFGLVTKFGETWMHDRGGATTRLSFDVKGKYQLWFAYGGGSPFAYSKASKGEFVDLKHGAQFGPATIEVELK